MKGNTLASVSLRAGIVALVLLIISFGAGLSIPGLVVYLMAAVTAIGAIVTGHIALTQTRQAPGTGSRRAAIGLALGYSLLVLIVIGIVLVFWVIHLPYY